MVEIIEGENIENIRALFQKAFIYDLCRILSDFNTQVHLIPKGFEGDPFHPQFVEIKIGVTNVFKTILENGEDNEILFLKKNLDVDSLFKVMFDSMQNFLQKKGIHYSSDIN